MRVLEMILVAVWALSLLEGFLAKGQRSWWSVLWAGVAGIICVEQIFVELPRWPMIPVYAGVVLNLVFVLLGLLWPRREFGPKKPRLFLRSLGAGFALIGWAVIASLGVIFPVPTLPQPSGPYAIGTTEFEWVDQSRQEVYSPQPGTFRDLMVKVWYPAVASGFRPETGWPDLAALATAVSRAEGFPDFFFSQYSLTKTHSQPGASLAASGGPFPVLLYSPGYGSIYTANTAQVEELASHGYVVFGIAHPYQNAVVYPDGRVILPLNEDHWQSLSPDQVDTRNRNASELRRAASSSADPKTKEDLAEQAMALFPIMEANAKMWADDSRFVLDQVEQLENGTDKRFAGHLDLTRVGAFGHSFGGSTAGLLVLTDPRVKAGINMDGQQWGLHGLPLPGPFLLMSTDTGGKADAGSPMYDSSPGPYFVLWIKGTSHQNYTDLALASPLFPLIGFLGPANPLRVEALVNQHVVAFFDETLRGVNTKYFATNVHNNEFELKVRKP